MQATENELGDGQEIFAYLSPWAGAKESMALDYLILVAGDALVYRPDKERVHTMEKAAVENNHTIVKT